MRSLSRFLLCCASVATKENLSSFDTGSGIHLLSVFELKDKSVKGMSDNDSSGSVLYLL